MVLSVRGRQQRPFFAVLVCSMLMGALLGAAPRPAAAAAADPLVPLLLKDVNPGPDSSSPSRLTVAGASLFFTATDAVDFEQWRKTDGTTAGTTMASYIPKAGLVTTCCTGTPGAFGGRMFFGGDDGTFGTELWSTDGTEAGTVLVKDINAGAAGGKPDSFVVVGGTLFFLAEDGSTGRELWKTDGTMDGTVLVKDINPGTGSGAAGALTAVGNVLFFSAFEPATGQELWKSDGTAAGTVMVKDVNLGAGRGFAGEMVAVGTTVFFRATDATGDGLWKSDGTATGTVLVGPRSSPVGVTAVGTIVYFWSGQAVWKSDGTTLGTVMVKAVSPGFAPGKFTPFGDIVLFEGSPPTVSTGAELWRSDGTDAGTVLVKDIFPGSGDGRPTGFTVVGTKAYFSATDGTTGAAHGRELWSTDGTTAGTVLVGDINPGTESSSPSSVTSAFGTLFFAATDGARGVEPWRLRTNAAPVAGNDAYTAKVDSPRSVPAPGVLGNDTDADGDVLTAGSVSAPANGTVTLNPDGSFTYTSNPGFTGPDSFTYVVRDGLGGTATGRVTMTILDGANQAPTAVDDAYGTNEDTPLIVPAPGLVGNDTDGDSDALSVAGAGAPASGSVSVNPDGSFTYSPAADFVGTDTFTYQLSDGYGGADTGTVTVAVSGVNDAPLAGADVSTTRSAGPPLVVPAPGVLGNDSDVDGDTLTAGSASAPAHGTVALNRDGSFTYTPVAGYGGVDTFTYVVSDGNGRSATGTVTVNVLNQSSVSSVRGGACSYSTNVSLFGGPLTLLGCGEAGRPPSPSPAPGSPVAVDPSYSPHVALAADGTGGSMSAADADGATAKYGPAVIHGGIWPATVGSAPPSGPQAAGTSGTPAGGSVTSSASIRLRDIPNPDSPGGFGPSPVEGESLRAECSASKTAVTGSTTFSNAVLSTSTNADGEPVNQEPVPATPPANYTRNGVITNVGDVFAVVFNQQIVNADGSLTVNGVHMYLFGPTGFGEVIRGSVTCGTNPSPLTPTDTVAPTCGTAVVKPKGPSDPTPKSPREELVGTFDAGNGGRTGIQSVTNIRATNATVQVGNPSSAVPELRFTPGQTGPLAVTATRTDELRPMSWSFDITDASGNTSSCQGAQSPPVAGDDTYTTPVGTQLTVPSPGVLANDTDANGDPLTAGSASDPPGGTVVLSPEGSFTYLPDPLFTGRDTFTYTVSDGTGTDTGLVTILVGNANRAPVAVDDTATTNQATPLTVPAPGVLGNDTDPDGDPLTAGPATAPANGTASLNPNGSHTYTPNAGFTGTDSFTYTVRDGFGGTDTGLVTVTVTAVNRAPVAGDDAYSTEAGRPVTAAAPGVLGNDTDADGNPLTAGSATLPTNGAVTLNADGSFVYTPNAGFTGADTFTYTTSDGQGGSDTGLVTIRIVARAVNANFDGDADSDVAVYRPDGSAWYVQAGRATGWGAPGDVPVPADYDGDGHTDIAVFRPSDQTWYVQGGLATQWGVSGDIPVPADYDGDGDADIAVFRPSDRSWYVQGGLATQWGVSGDVPVPADYDGDGDADIAVYRPGDQTWYAQGGLATQWGAPGDKAVPADYNGDGRVDVAVFRPSDQTWYSQGAGGIATQWGARGDIPVAVPAALRTLYGL